MMEHGKVDHEEDYSTDPLLGDTELMCDQPQRLCIWLQVLVCVCAYARKLRYM
jgi:hypothetical protein